MGDGELSISAYDTAWVALIKNIDGSDINAPQFPSCLKWIADNQLPDGSWGDDKVFLAHDRLINTLACIVALKSWDAHLDKCEKGILKIEMKNYCCSSKLTISRPTSLSLNLLKSHVGKTFC